MKTHENQSGLRSSCRTYLVCLEALAPGTVTFCRRCCMSANYSRSPLRRPSVSQRISRRKVLLELVALAGAGSTLTWLEGCGSTASTPPLPPTTTSTLYPNLTGRFGSVLTVGVKADFLAAK